MGKKWDQFLALLGKKESNDISQNEFADENLMKAVIGMLQTELEGKKVNKNQVVKQLNNDNKQDNVEMSSGEAKSIIEEISEKIQEFNYKSKKLVNLFEDDAIYNEISTNIVTIFDEENNFSSKINNHVIQFIINNKTLLKKYKGCLHVAKWPKYLSKLPMNKTFDLGCAEADIQKDLYDTNPTPSTKDAPNPKLVSWLTILGPASLKFKKRVGSIKNIVKKRIASIADKIDNEKTNNNIDLTNGIIGQCQKYLKNKKSVDVYLCLALTYSDTIKTLNTIGNTLVQKEGEQRTWENIELQKINVNNTPEELAKFLQKKLNAAIKTSKDRKYLDDTEINVGKRPNLDN